MFVRQCWRPRSREEALEIIDDYPWALLVTSSEEGPFATNLPLLLDRTRGEHGVLLGHLARANAHARVLLRATTPTLAIFQGPYTYVTPSWYPNRDMPGTYYYTAVHCYGRVRPQSEEELEKTLWRLNERMEKPIPGGWRIDEIPHSEIARRLPAIAGFEIDIERFEAKLKLGQDEPRKDAMAVAEHLAASSDPSLRRLSGWIKRANENRPKDGSK